MRILTLSPVYIILFVFLSGLGSALKANPLTLENDFVDYPLGLFMEYLPDPGGVLKPADIQKLPDSAWKKSQKRTPGFGFKTHPYWVRFTLKNPRAQAQELYLEQTFPLIDRMELFEVKAGVLRHAYTVGEHKPFAERPLAHRNFVLPLRLEAGEEVQYLIRQRTNGAMNFHLFLWTPEPFKKTERTAANILLVFYGLLGGLIAYNLFLFLSVRNLSYFHYVLFAVNLLLFGLSNNGLSFQYVWPESAWWANVSGMVFLGFTVYHAIGFSLGFMNVSGFMPLWAWILKTYGRFVVAFALGSFLFQFFCRVFFQLDFMDFKPGTELFSGLQNLTIRGTVLLSLIGLVFLLYTGIRLCFKSQRSAYYFTLAWIVFLASSMAKILKDLGFFPANFVTNWGMFLGSGLEIILLSLGLADRINTMAGELKKMNVELEDKVEQRTGELRKLLDQQNNDYFLTSLLFKPLNFDANVSPRIKTSFVIEQMKKVHFRNNYSEIGGDLCITQNITLNGKNYLVFLNGDAMGKSLQGASGVIVLGTSFKTYLNQHKNREDRREPPEIWLAELYRFLNRLLASFEGAMFVTGLLGLLEEDTGCLYLINSDHPRSVLYRNKKARFIGSESHLGMLGIEDQKEIQVKTLQLKDKDIIVAGSDGRDDFLIGPVDDMNVNDDERLFLEFVEKGRGDPLTVLSEIKKHGTLRDDCSLLGLMYKGDYSHISGTPNEPALLRLLKRYRRGLLSEKILLSDKSGVSPETPIIKKILGYMAFKKGLYQKAVEYLGDYHNRHAVDFGAALKYSRALAEVGHVPEAIELCECLYLRRSRNLSNLLLLARLQLKVKNFTRAQYLSGLLQNIAPENQDALELDRMLESREDA